MTIILLSGPLDPGELLRTVGPWALAVVLLMVSVTPMVIELWRRRKPSAGARGAGGGA